MNIPKLTDEQISKAKKIWNAMNKEMEEQGMRLCYDYDHGSMVVVPKELEPCEDVDEMIPIQDHQELMKMGRMYDCDNSDPWFCVEDEYSFSVKDGE